MLSGHEPLQFNVERASEWETTDLERARELSPGSPRFVQFMPRCRGAEPETDISYSAWEDASAFQPWTQSEAFRRGPRPGHPRRSPDRSAPARTV